MLRALLYKRADGHAKDEQQMTRLHLAAATSRDRASIELLVANRATHIKHNQARTPLDIAHLRDFHPKDDNSLKILQTLTRCSLLELKKNVEDISSLYKLGHLLLLQKYPTILPYYLFKLN